MEIIFTHDCHKCDTEMQSRVLVISGTYPITFLSQFEFTCPECGELHINGDIDIMTESDF